jgi:hypothetical protein
LDIVDLRIGWKQRRLAFEAGWFSFHNDTLALTWIKKKNLQKVTEKYFRLAAAKLSVTVSV